MAKFLKSIRGGRVGNFFAGAVVASVIGGTAVAITSPNFTYSQVQRGYYTINAMAMAPRDNLAGDAYFIAFPQTLGGDGCYLTGVNLPQGATVVGVTTWYSSAASSNPTILLYRQNLPNNASNALVNALIVDDTNTRKPITIAVPVNRRTVDNLYFSYGYGVCLGLDDYFIGARINYLYRTAGD